MKVKLHSKTDIITDAMVEAAEKEFKKLEKFVTDEPAKIYIERTKKALKMKAQVVLKSNKHIRCEINANDYYKGLKKVVANLVEQAKSVKEKISHKGRIEKVEPVDVQEDSYPKIVKTKYFNVDSITEDMAMSEMEKLGHEAYIFKNMNLENKVCMLYKRVDGDYSMIVVENGEED